MSEKKPTSRSKSGRYRSIIRVSQEAKDRIEERLKITLRTWKKTKPDDKKPAEGTMVDEIFELKEVALAPEDMKTLQTLSMKLKKPPLSKEVLLGHMIQSFEKAGKDPADFLSFLEDNSKKIRSMAPDLELPEDSCLQLVVLTTTFATKDDETNYHCVRGSKSGTVKIKKIGKFKEQIENVCVACEFRVNLEERWKEILAKDQHGLEEHTYCSKGEEIDVETGKIKCGMQGQSLGGMWFDQEVCFTIDEGRKCPMLRTLPAKAVKKTGIKRRYRK